MEQEEKKSDIAGMSESTQETVDTIKTSAEAKEKKSSRAGKIFSACGAVLTVVAWVLLIFNGQASLSFGAAAMVLSSLAMRKTVRGWRNLAVTSIVASGVLLIVLVIFLVVVDIVIRSL